VNFSKLGPGAIKADDGTVTIRCPARLATAVIDPKASRVVGRDRGIVDRVAGVFNDADRRSATTVAQNKIVTAAKHSNLVLA
jgi:hypothetical protein